MCAPHWCACGCRAPITDGMVVFRVGGVHYVKGCVQEVLMECGDEKVLGE